MVWVNLIYYRSGVKFLISITIVTEVKMDTYLRASGLTGDAFLSMVVDRHGALNNDTICKFIDEQSV